MKNLMKKTKYNQDCKMKQKISLTVILSLMINVYPLISINKSMKKGNDHVRIESKHHVMLFADDGKNGVTENSVNASNREDVIVKVMLVVLFVWLGLAAYLFRMDRKIVKLEKEINEL